MNIVETPAPGGTLLTLYKEKQPVGSCLLCPQAEGVRIERLEIDPAWRRRGYGSYLLRQALHRTGGFEKGRASLYTAALPADEGAGAFAARFGFAAAEGALVRRRTPPLTAVELTHRFLAAHLHPGGKFLDATCGNGGDTEFLCRLAGPEGWVLGLDIQARAVATTNARLAAAGLGTIGRAVQADHADLAAYLPEGGIDAAVFNFGYLPGADHHRFSTPATSLPALEAALAALPVQRRPQRRRRKKGGAGLAGAPAPDPVYGAGGPLCQLGRDGPPALLCAEKSVRRATLPPHPFSRGAPKNRCAFFIWTYFYIILILHTMNDKIGFCTPAPGARRVPGRGKPMRSTQ